MQRRKFLQIVGQPETARLAAYPVAPTGTGSTRCKTYKSRGGNMTTIRLIDYADAYLTSIADAINTATAEGFAVNTYADAVADAQLDTSEDYAAEVAEVDAALVYLTGAGPLDEIDEGEWARVCGSQDRPTFARLAIDNGQTVADAWTEAQLAAQALA